MAFGKINQGQPKSGMSLLLNPMALLCIHICSHCLYIPTSSTSLLLVFITSQPPGFPPTSHTVNSQPLTHQRGSSQYTFLRAAASSFFSSYSMYSAWAIRISFTAFTTSAQVTLLNQIFIFKCLLGISMCSQYFLPQETYLSHAPLILLAF